MVAREIARYMGDIAHTCSMPGEIWADNWLACERNDVVTCIMSHWHQTCDFGLPMKTCNRHYARKCLFLEHECQWE